MSLFLRLTIAMVALVLLTGSVIGLIAYRNIEQAVIPETLRQISTETALKAQQLEASVRSASSDAVAFSSAVAVDGIMRATATDAKVSGGLTIDQWRTRLAHRFAAELQAKSIYSQFRLIAVAGNGRELIRVDRSGPGGSIRIVRDDELQSKGDRSYFQSVIAQRPGEAYVSPVALNDEHGRIVAPYVPTLHAGAMIPGPDGKPFGAIVINLDLRGIFGRIRVTEGGQRRIYLVNENGDFLIHPDRSHEFEFEFGVPYRLQDEFPVLATELITPPEERPSFFDDRLGDRFGVGLESVRLAGGPRVTLIEAVPYPQVAAAVTKLGYSILFGGALALFGAVVAALLLARSLSQPLVQMRKAVEGFARNQVLSAPIDAGGEIGVLARAFQSTTQEIQAQAAALKKEIRVRRRMFDSSLDLILITDRAGHLAQVSPSCQAILGYQPQEMIGRSGGDFVYSGDLDATRQEMRLGRRGKAMRNFETRYVHKDGHPVTLAWSGVWSEAEQSHFFIGRDMTEKNKAEEAVRDSERMARAIIDTALDAFIQLDERGNVIDWSPQAEMLFGWPRDEAIGQNFGEMVIPPENRDAFSQRFTDMSEAARISGVGVRFEEDSVRIDGTRVKVEIAVTALARRHDHVFNGFVRDITEKVANEDKLRQSQKMEAIGQLTGGIAHDFNNMLTVITGTIEILAEGVADRPEMVAITKLISEAADRGAELTSHLLAFARKQPLRPRETAINELVAGAEKLFRPVLGENIEIVSRFTPDIWPALVDHSQLTTALLNLAVNARDAMPRGGKLTIETGNVFLEENYTKNHRDLLPGEYVMIAISDTGTGIPDDVRAKVFEPFFTTKEAGKGTGLGLSMVYGFVKQSGGHVMIYSEEGEGTSVRIYLPRATGQSAGATDDRPTAMQGGSESVLVVEDDPLVRGYVVKQLEGLGYQTMCAANAAEAMALVEAGTPFDLLFTDVIMPGPMNGRQLADEIVKRMPQVKVLFTSGYTETALIHHGRLDAGVVLLNKPYRKSELARMVRSALAA